MTLRQEANLRKALACRKERKRQDASRRGKLGVAARARKRMFVGEGWTTFERLLRISVSPCGRYLSVETTTGWHRCGSERAVRAEIAKALWQRGKPISPAAPPAHERMRRNEPNTEGGR